MPKYTIELRKHIVVEVEAENEGIARAMAVSGEHDGAWENQEAEVVEVLNVEED